MSQRQIKQERSFNEDLVALFDSAEEADEILDGAIIFLSTRAETGKCLPGSKMLYKIISDFPNDRYLVIFYMFDEEAVCLHSIKEFGA